MSAFENEGTRDFDIGAMSDISQPAFDELDPFMWPRVATRDENPTRYFADGRFYTPDGKARFVAVKPAVALRTSGAFPFVLNTGRVRDHWHTMTRTAKSARLSQHLAEPFVEVHPLDADRLQIADAEIVRVESPLGSILVRALRSTRPAIGSVFVPMHWNDQYASSARVDVLLPGMTDPISGQPASKHAAVRLERFAAVNVRLCCASNEAEGPERRLLGIGEVRRWLAGRVRRIQGDGQIGRLLPPTYSRHRPQPRRAPITT